jgi:hypothetical protein
LSCALCEERKEKRFCPALHAKICPQCCGEQREVTLDCPSDCSYLLQARAQLGERGRVTGEQTVAEREVLFPAVEIPEQFLYEREELILGLSFALAKSARVDRTLTDRDLISTVSSLAKSYQMLVNSSLIYEQPTANLAHQAVTREVETMVKEFREAEKQNIGHTRLRDSDVLRALVFLLRLAYGRTSGRPKSRAFVDFLFGQFPEKASVLAVSEEIESRIVTP